MDNPLRRSQAARGGGEEERTDCLGHGLGGECNDVRDRGKRSAAVGVKLADGLREVGEVVRRDPPLLRSTAARWRLHEDPLVQHRHQLRVALLVLHTIPAHLSAGRATAAAACRLDHFGRPCTQQECTQEPGRAARTLHAKQAADGNG